MQVGPDISGIAAADLFGMSVSISADGTTIVAGGPNNDGSGLARVYKFNANRW